VPLFSYILRYCIVFISVGLGLFRQHLEIVISLKRIPDNIATNDNSSARSDSTDGGLVRANTVTKL
jgi:hypothetical protein